jgi:uncharacterized protein (TIGR00369 family)
MTQADQSPTPSGEELARGWFQTSPFIGLLDLRLVSLERDTAVVEMPFRAELATAGDVVHGGAIGSLLDTAAALAAWSSHEPSQGTQWGTVGYSVSFLAPGRGQTVRATATVSRRGRSICHCRVEAAAEDGEAVAEALVAYRLG